MFWNISCICVVALVKLYSQQGFFMDEKVNWQSAYIRVLLSCFDAQGET